MSWDWEDIWGAILAGTAVTVLVISIGIVSFAPKEITYYYGSQGDHGVCVYSHWIWHVDERVFCPQNQAELPEFVERFNATLPKLGTK